MDKTITIKTYLTANKHLIKKVHSQVLKCVKEWTELPEFYNASVIPGSRKEQVQFFHVSPIGLDLKMENLFQK